MILAVAVLLVKARLADRVAKVVKRQRAAERRVHIVQPAVERRELVVRNDAVAAAVRLAVAGVIRGGRGRRFGRLRRGSGGKAELL